MKGYKSFNPGLVCRGKQYVENTVFEEPEAVLCDRGMHFCENPLNTLNFYDLVSKNGEITEFAEVDAPEECVVTDGVKSVTTKLHIGAKLSLKGFINAAVDFIFEKTQENGNDESAARLASSGAAARLASSGDGARLASSGADAQLASSGDGARLASSGDGARLASSGYAARLASSGDDGICAAIGENSIAKGSVGTWIILAEYENNIPVCVKVGKIDGEILKPNVFYKLENGKFVEVSENE